MEKIYGMSVWKRMSACQVNSSERVGRTLYQKKREMYGDQNQSNWFDPSASSQGWGQFDYSQTPTQQPQNPSNANSYYMNAQAQMNQDSFYAGNQMFIPAAPSQKQTTEEDFENEPPLLEELGINFDHIRQKTLAVLNPVGAASAEVIADQDLAGPLVFCLLFGASLLLHGKVHFGYIYGIGGLGCVGMYALLNLMAADKSISFTCTASVLGYCLLPMALLSMLAAVLSFQGVFGYISAGAAVLWCSSSSSKLFTITLAMEGQRILVAYPCTLLYCVFALLAIF
uniref:Protein YIPF n=1 Tax=Steinernema glaseri TaxID=37863 RepID=A0A1I7YCW1_9BILA